MIGKTTIHVLICLEMDCNILMNVWANAKIYFLSYPVLYLKKYSLLHGHWWEIFYLALLTAKAMNMYVYDCTCVRFENLSIYVYRHINIKKVITISRRIKISKDIGYKYLSLRYPSSAVLNIGLLLSNAFLEEKWSTHFNQSWWFLCLL